MKSAFTPAQSLLTLENNPHASTGLGCQPRRRDNPDSKSKQHLAIDASSLQRQALWRDHCSRTLLTDADQNKMIINAVAF